VNRNAQHNNFYVDKCAQAIRGLEGSEQWTVKFDFILGPGKSIELGINEGVPFPTPDDGFWLKSSHAMVTDKTDTEVFCGLPFTCITSCAGPIWQTSGMSRMCLSTRLLF